MTRTILIALALAACSTPQIGSGDAQTVHLDLQSGISGISLENFVDTQVMVTDAQPDITLTCDDNLLDEIIADVEDGVLRVRTEIGKSLAPRTDCHAEVQLNALTIAVVTGSGNLDLSGNLDELTNLSSTGSGDLFADVVHTCDLDIAHTGSGAVDIGELTACSVDLSQSGSGAIHIDGGGTDDLHATLTGSGGFPNPDFQADVADLLLTGSGDAELTVNDAVKARMTGSGGVIIHGDPQERDIKSSGSGQADFR